MWKGGEKKNVMMTALVVIQSWCSADYLFFGFFSRLAVGLGGNGEWIERERVPWREVEYGVTGWGEKEE